MICFNRRSDFGVVLTTARGASPWGPGSRSAICSMSQTASGSGQEVSSSHQAPSKFGPRNRSGSSALNR